VRQQSFFAELQRRHVYKVGAAYAVAGWLLVQVITQVFPIYEISTHVQRIFVGVIIAGFPVALMLAWLFDLTPQGIVRTKAQPAEGETPAVQQDRRSTDRKLNYVLAMLLLVAVGGFIAERTVLEPAQSVAESVSKLDKSIAVLPFENLSDDKANEYFASGIQDEILARLSKIAALKVISRTSTQQYAAKPGNLKEIANQLGVTTILEGSVQRIGKSVHVTVQLIRAATDEHLWAESYNRQLDDVFAVEAEVAQTVANSLKATLSPAEQAAIATRPTENLAAYEAYQRGRTIEQTTYSYPDSAKALDSYYEAVRLDPQFALAWAAAAETGSFLYYNGVDSPQATPQAILGAAVKAQRLQPGLGEAWLAQGYYLYRVQQDLPAALQAFETAHQILPNSAQSLSALERIERRLGHWDEAIAHEEKALELDPRNVQLLVQSGAELLNYLRRFDEARATLQRALAVAPDDPTALCNLAYIERQDGHLDAARGWLKKLATIPSFVDLLICNNPLDQGLYDRNYEDVIQQAERYVPKGDGPVPLSGAIFMALGQAQALQLAGRTVEAQKAFARIVRSIKPTAETPVPVNENELYGVLALAYAGLGERDAALSAARTNVDSYRFDAVDLAAAQITLAQVEAQVGEKDAAIAVLPELLRVPAGLTGAQLRYEPIWDPLRSDPGFQKLLGNAVGGPAQ